MPGARELQARASVTDGRRPILKEVTMTGNRVLIGLCALVLLVGSTAVAPAGQGGAQHSEQIIFSGTGFGTFNDTQSPFGFWIWCQDADSSTPYAAECNGAM